MADNLFTKAVGNVATDVLNKSGLGKLYEAGSKLLSKNRLGSGKAPPAAPENFDVKFEGEKDFRAKIRVPSFYRYIPNVMPTVQLLLLDGIVFPYTPTISQDYTANYNPINPTHSNYTLYFYKHSTPGPITVSGKFTVQNDTEAYIWLATTHMLRAVMKMRFGANGEEDRGAPPPVCRFDAYGDQQYKDVPVVVSSFRVELPDGVDYYATSLSGMPGLTTGDSSKGNMVPTVSTLSVTLFPMYSRQELLSARHVTDYVTGKPNLRQRGFL
jgi:hypothetical protein